MKMKLASVERGVRGWLLSVALATTLSPFNSQTTSSGPTSPCPTNNNMPLAVVGFWLGWCCGVGFVGLTVLWCGVVWCGVVWCGAVWCGVVRCGVVWCGAVWCGVVWCGKDEVG